MVLVCLWAEEVAWHCEGCERESVARRRRYGLSSMYLKACVRSKTGKRAHDYAVSEATYVTPGRICGCIASMQAQLK